MIKTIFKSKYLVRLLLAMAVVAVASGLALSTVFTASAEGKFGGESIISRETLNGDGVTLTNYYTEARSGRKTVDIYSFKIEDKGGNVIYEGDGTAEACWGSEDRYVWLCGSGKIMDYVSGEVKSVLDHDAWFCNKKEIGEFMDLESKSVYAFRLGDSLTQPVYTFLGEDYRSLGGGLVLVGEYGTGGEYIYGERAIGMSSFDGKKMLRLCEDEGSRWEPKTEALLMDFDGNILYQREGMEVLGINGNNAVVRKKGEKSTEELSLDELRKNPVR